jgi:hypothetical protein
MRVAAVTRDDRDQRRERDERREFEVNVGRSESAVFAS